MKRVIATGVFNILHPGHIAFLEAAREIAGDYGELIVIVTSDVMAKKQKGKHVLPAEQRRDVVGSLKIVSSALIGDPIDMMVPIKEVCPDVIILGFDQEISEKELEEKLEKAGINADIIRIKESKKGEYMSTSSIVEKIRNSK